MFQDDQDLLVAAQSAIKSLKTTETSVKFPSKSNIYEPVDNNKKVAKELNKVTQKYRKVPEPKSNWLNNFLKQNQIEIKSRDKMQDIKSDDSKNLKNNNNDRISLQPAKQYLSSKPTCTTGSSTSKAIVKYQLKNVEKAPGIQPTSTTVSNTLMSRTPVKENVVNKFKYINLKDYNQLKNHPSLKNSANLSDDDDCVVVDEENGVRFLVIVIITHFEKFLPFKLSNTVAVSSPNPNSPKRSIKELPSSISVRELSSVPAITPVSTKSLSDSCD